jgi:hypothetical protein
MSWTLTDCFLPDERERVQVTYLRSNREYCDVFAVLVGNEWYTEDSNGSIMPFKHKVIAWQYPCSPCTLEEFDKNCFEMNLEHFKQYIQHEKLSINSEAHRIFSSSMTDTVYIVKPTVQIDIKAINELYFYKNCGSICDIDLRPPITKEDIGSLIVVVCTKGDFRSCEFIQVARYDKVIQKVKKELNKYTDKFI